MSTFDDKVKAAENKYAHDKEAEFKVRARRDKLLGLWVAEKMGLNKADADAYAAALTTLDLDKSHHESILAHIKEDLVAKGHTISEHDLRAKMHHFLHQAKEQLAGN